ncbi:CPK10 [Symbiodinium sp. KB8]|nr:CPK10 [Symbiodinium sp. KB8]
MARGRRNSSRIVLVLGAGVAAYVTANSLPGFAFTGLGRAASMGLQQTTRSSVTGAERPVQALPSRPALPVGIEEVTTTSSLLESMGPLGVAGQAVAGLAALYIIMSFCEYVYHRYFQHLGLNKVDAVRAVRSTLNLSTFRGDGHVEHHRETVEEDMSLTIEPGRDPILDMDPWRGTCFPWDGFAKMSAGVMLLAYPTLTLLGWSGFVIVPVVMTAMILHALVWNALHPNMHGLEDVPVEVGAPSWVLAGLRDSAVFNYLRTNHEGAGRNGHDTQRFDVGEDPDNVRSCFLEHDIDVGVYGIRFFLDGEWYHTIIDDWMPVDQYGRLLYAKSYDHDEVWVPLLEKGFCKMHRCYEMCDGGLPGEAVSLLFGGAMGKLGSEKSPQPAVGAMYKKQMENRLRQWTSRFAASGVMGCLVLWGMRRLLRREWLRAVSCQNVTEGIGSSVRSVLANTFTSFGAAAAASNERSRSALVDESMEPRAEELELPLPLQSKVLRHISFYDVYDVGDEEVLGTGMHGAVLVAKHRKSGRRVAAKCLEGAEGPLPDEVSLYLRLSHPNICRLLQAFVEKNGDIWLCMELCSGGELFELAAGTSSVVRQGLAMLDTEARIAVLVKQMAAAIRYIHSMGMVHRDIKLENWVFASPAQERLKLIDFGLATAYIAGKDDKGRTQKLNQMCGTCYYVAPEVIGLKDGAICKGDGYGQEVDIWALGVLVYMLVSGMPPFNGKSHADVIWNIANFKFCDDPLADAFVGPRWENVSPQCKDLIRRCMERDPQKRLTAAGVQVHPWLCQVGPKGPVAPVTLAPILKDLCFAGNRMATCGVLAQICCSLASTIYLSPETWTEYKDHFAKLECLETLAPKGSLSVSKLVSAFEEAMANKTGLYQKPAELKEVDSFRAISSLDITGDGRLHFFEFLGAMIAAGRIQIHEHDIADVFAAFDVDRDDVISEQDMASFIHNHSMVLSNTVQSAEKLQLPIKDHDLLLEALNRKPTWGASEKPQAVERVANSPSPSPQAAPSGAGMQRLLSKAKRQMEWKVQRQVAFADVRSAVKLKSLNRGWRTPDPSPTRIDKESSPENGVGLVGRNRGKMAQSMLTLTDLDKK